MLLAVNMIVKDEAAVLDEALASVRGLADEVVVYDTGSRDDTVARARAAGATVVEGYWDDDFARARNAALAATSADWVLTLDADERWRGDAERLRRRLATASPAELFRHRIRNTGDGVNTGYVERRIAIYPRRGVHWAGRVHENVLGPEGRLVRDLDPSVSGALHVGNADPGEVARKAARNAQLARRELGELLQAGRTDPATLCPVLLHLGRSCLGSSDHQGAVEALETVRELVSDGYAWQEATDYLARTLLIAGGHDEVVVGLAEQLRASGADPQYCAWLAAPALAQLGHVRESLTLLDGITRIVDPMGIEHDLGMALELRAMVASLAGDRDLAVASIVEAMAVHGRVTGRGDLLLQLWTGSADELAERLGAVGGERREALAEELARWQEPGPSAARALLAAPAI